MVIMFAGAFGSIAVLLVVIQFTEGMCVPTTAEEVLPLLGLALMAQVLGQGLLAFSLGKVNAALSSIICLTQPVIASIYAFLLFSETLSPMEIVSMLICISGVYFAKRNYS